MSADPKSPERATPERWRAAAAQLIAALREAREPELQLGVLKRVARRFGDQGYPAFVKLLLVVADSDDTAAKRVLADTLALGLRRTDLPGGQLTSWGATQFWETRQPLPAGRLPGNALGSAPRRTLGPIEYLTVWHCQRTQRPYLGEDRYRGALTALVGLIGHSEEARALYPQRIESEVGSGLEGAYTRLTRERLATLAASWKQSSDPAAIADATIGAQLPPTPQGWVLHTL